MFAFSQLQSRLPDLSKPRALFLIHLLRLFVTIPGKINYRNLARHSHYCEKTFRRHFKKNVEFLEINMNVMNAVIPPTNREALATDASFCPKSGKKTYGLAKYWNGVAGRSEKGLEFSTFAHIDVDHRSAYALDTRQTPSEAAESTETKMDFFVRHLREFVAACRKKYSILVADGYYAKKKYVDAAREVGLDLISKLRRDANLKYLYQGPPRAGKGRPKKYDGKVCFDDLSRFQCETIREGKVTLYSLVVRIVCFQCEAKVVIARNAKGKQFAVLFSTDTSMSAEEIFDYYTSRFQIEFLFRDAKQHCGLTDFLARDEASIHFHVNASLTATTLARLDMRSKQEDINAREPLSLAAFKRRHFNRYYMEAILDQLGPQAKLRINESPFQRLLELGVIEQDAA